MLILGGLHFAVKTSISKTSASHPSSTGAPSEEVSCAKSSCHDDVQLKYDDSTVISLTISDSLYSLGKQYTLTLTANDGKSDKFGFQIVALDYKNENVGEWIITDSVRTQPQEGIFPVADRKYVTHTSTGTEQISNGLSEWKFDWIAPGSNLGTVTFYYAVICTKADQTVFNDSIYVSNSDFKSSWGTSTDDIKEFSQNVIISQQNGLLLISFESSTEILKNISIFDLQGKKVDEILNSVRQKRVLNQSISYPIGSRYKSGVYLVRFLTNSGAFSKKIYISNTH